MKREEARSEVERLVKKYNSYKEQGLLKRYNEDNTCKDFILPLFRSLGWGVENSREVEGQKNVSGGRVDYAFYLDGIPKFFLEAKAISEDLNKESYIKQAIDYAYNKGVTWAVLSDFEGIKVFNAEWHTVPAKACVLNLSVGDYLTDFDLLWELSKEGIGQDLLYERARKIGQVAVKEPIGERLYKDLTLWRELFFKYISGYHPDFNFAQVDEIIQRILNRFVFIRTCEDRKIEPPYLLPLAREWRSSRNINLQQKIKELFKDFDLWYNSKLFAHHLCDDIDIEDTPYAEVIEGLYGSKDEIVRYDFNAIGVDVLGRVYEQYLGYVAKTVEPKRKRQLALEGLESELIKIEKEKKRRKEQGIYYTPTFIVDYIVKNALKPVLDKCDCVEDLKKIKVLDPACGSGSFLIKALEAINDKYKEFNYAGDELTKIQIFNENIYGVDLDEQAVEIARLNLLLNSLDRRMELPLLRNIRNGNSLISGTDEELKKYFGENFRDKKPFNWQEEFPEVFKQGGFDVVIGNPPYIKEFVNKSAFNGLHNSPYYQGKMDIWTMFGCVSVDLLKKGGILSFIAPNNWVSNAGANIFRDKILKDGELKLFIDFGDYKVFEEAGIQTMIFVFEKKKPNEKYITDYLRIDDKNIKENKLISLISGKKNKIEIKPKNLIGKNVVFASREHYSVLCKIEDRKNFVLTEKEVGQGIVAAPDKYFLEKNIDTYYTNEQNFLKKFYTSVERYRSGTSENYIFYICDKNFGDKKIEKFPNIKKHFEPFEKILEEAKTKYGTPQKPYFYLHREREEMFFSNGPKVVCGVRVKYPSFYYTDQPYYGSRALNFIKTSRINLKYLTGILNSNVCFFWLINKGKQLGDLLQVDKRPLLEIPIFVGSKKQQEQVIGLVDKILFLNQELQNATQNSEKWNFIKSEIEKIDKKINEEVYKLYGLTSEEIAIIERNEQ